MTARTDTSCTSCGYVVEAEGFGIMLRGRVFWGERFALKTWAREVEDIRDDDARELFAAMKVRAVWRRCGACACGEV